MQQRNFMTLIRPEVCLIMLALTLGGKLYAGTIYDNSVNDLSTRFNPGSLEVGDEIILSVTDPSRYLQTFSFEYYGTNTAGASFSGSVTAQVRFYLNDGPLDPVSGYPTPGTGASILYDSGAF